MSKKKVKKLNHTTVWIDECTNITDDQWNYLSQKSIQSIDNARLLHLIKMSNPKGESVLFRLYNEHHNPESLDKFECGCDFGSGKDQSVDYFVTKIDGGVKIEIPSVNLEFSKTLNELKNKNTMEITEETRIKDLIPEGYELSTQTISTNGIHIDIKKKVVKDFDWYMKQYRLKSYRHIDKNNFLKASFESKIGLLKFICDDLNISWLSIVQEQRQSYSKIIDNKSTVIIPEEFLNSIFN